MDKIFLRNFFLLFLILALCVSVLGFILVSGEKSISRTDDMVVHTYEIITRAEQLSTSVEGMLAAQRGYVLSGNSDFLTEYESKKAELTELVAKLSELTADNPQQTSRIDEIRHHILVFTERLEERSRQVKLNNRVTRQNASDDVIAINDARVNIRRINEIILKSESDLLNKRISQMEDKKRQYFNSLLLGAVIGAILLLLINSFLFQAQSRRSRAERSLEESERRFTLAVEGTNDGIFDYNLVTGEIFYSANFFKMIGYDRPSYTGKRDDATNLIHPDDIQSVMDYLNRYLRREISEYSNIYRMRHATGRWVWINSRGKAIYDASGNAVRLVGSHTDISFMKDYQEKLKEEKDAAEQANRAKSDFLAHMSHEIRTPLTAISGIAEILEKNKTTLDDKQQKLIRTLGTSTSSLKDLINDILDFSKIESGDLELDERTFKLEELFEQVISIMTLKAQEKGLSFKFDYSAVKNVRFFGDNTRLRQILINLIGNALKFSDQGSVNVTAIRTEQNGTPALRIDVTDTGIGIAPEKFDLIFERFKQADSSVSRKYGGTGLGLPISKNLALMMGGDILLESQVGKGSTFTLIVPFQLSTDEEDEVESVDPSIARKLNDQIRASLSGEDRILVVEDYEGNIVVIGYILDDLGLNYDVAKTGVEAINLWKERHYDVILMDVQMPEMDGLTASTSIRQIEKEKNLARTPIIGMTAHALVADKNKCIEAGMDAYLPKPIVESDMKTQILKFLSEGADDTAAA